ncbi:enoyl-(acyl carrier protein) reductase [Escherichia coli]|nr:enoyl-(acyl carrier protein) reductase [Escherichia coli]
MGFLSGKRILVTGVASKLSIAYGIAQAMHREGAELAFTYQNDKLKGRVEEFAAQLGSDIVLQCDVAEDASIDTMFAELGKVWPKFDGFVHSIGFAPGDQLDGDYVNAVTREGFKIAPRHQLLQLRCNGKSLPLHAESGFCPADPFLPWR